jgi:hypothetical protein
MIRVTLAAMPRQITVQVETLGRGPGPTDEGRSSTV